MKCRISGELCKESIRFGKMPLANGFIKNIYEKEYVYNLTAFFSKKSQMFQINKFPKPKQMFNKNYPFYTSSSNYMIDHFRKYAKFIFKNFIKKKKKYLICEIGSNDGTFLKNFKSSNSIGFEPSKSVHNKAIKNKVNSINNFFNLKNIKFLRKKFNKFDLVVGSNVFCHIPDQKNLIQSIDKLLNKKGSIVFEEPYLGSMYKKISYDQIYDEHIYMFSAHSVQKLYAKYNFQLIDVIPQDTHGGSLRYILKRNGVSKQTKRLINFLNFEKKNKINSINGFLKFKKNVEKSKMRLKNKITKILSRGEKICGYGATSKSTTILNYCNINNKMIDCIFDTTKDKIGKYTPLTHIPIVNYSKFKKSNYQNVFLFAWNHKKEIMKKEKNKKGIHWFTHL